MCVLNQVARRQSTGGKSPVSAVSELSEKFDKLNSPTHRLPPELLRVKSRHDSPYSSARRRSSAKGDELQQMLEMPPRRLGLPDKRFAKLMPGQDSPSSPLQPRTSPGYVPFTRPVWRSPSHSKTTAP